MSFRTETKEKIVEALFDSESRMRYFAGYYGIVNGIAREDGSGTSFLVTMTIYTPKPNKHTFLVKVRQ